MYCNNCGSEVKSGSKFCPKCGAPVTPTETQKEETSGFPNDDTATSDSASSQPSSEINASTQKRRPKWWIFVIIAVVVVVVILAIVFGRRSSREINLNDYVTVEFAGYEGYGTADVSFDWDSLSSKYDQKIKVDQSGWGGFYDSFSELLDDCIYMHVDPESGLSNGDEVTVSWDVDTEDLDACIEGTIKISADPETYTVSGLEKGDTFDAFEGVSVEFSGTSPDATAAIIKSADVPSQLSFSLDRSEGLSIDDTVTVRISDESANAYMQEDGLFPEELTKSFPVENVAYYVTDLDQIPEDGMDKMKEQAEDVFNSIVAEWDSEERVLKSMDYVGSYFLTEKEGVENANANMIYMVYNIHATQLGKEANGNQTEESVDYYWYLGFTNGMVLADGTFSIDYNDNITPSAYSNFITETGDGFNVITYDYTQEMPWSQEIDLDYTGFKDLDSMFNSVVTSRIDEYNYESTVE